MGKVIVLSLLPPRKRAKMRLDDLVALAKEQYGQDVLEIVEVERAKDLDYWIGRSLAEDVRVVVLHKVIELLVEDPDSIELMRDCARRWATEERVRFVDDPEVTVLLTDRWRMWEALERIREEEFIPPFRLPPTMEMFRHGDNIGSEMFPAIVKPLDACTTENAHLMHFVRNLEDYRRLAIVEPHLVQRYIPHHETLYKIYLIGPNHMNIVVRPSVREADETQAFDSQALRYQPHLQPGSLEYAEAVKRVAPLESRLKAISHLISVRLCPDHPLTLFGWDLIISEGTEEDNLYVIDVNFFPGFDGAPDFHQHLLSLLIK